MDDTFVVWNDGRDKFQDFLWHLISIRHRIQYGGARGRYVTFFLDVLVMRGADRLATTVYRKANYTAWDIYFTSNHHNKGSHQIFEVELE